MSLFPSYIFRLSLQHRALYCYLVLSVWIFVLLGGMYKYIGREDDSLNILKLTVTDITTRTLTQSIKPDVKSGRVIKVCNAPKEILLGSEGLVNGNYSLEGVLVLIRHGDRGPLSHIRNISKVNCLGPSDPLYSMYEDYITNITGTPILSQILGSFHGFPPLPGTECALGQLTRLGASQLLATGRILREAYGESLGMGNTSTFKRDFVVYSTRYRRTLQSALAFLYSFLPREDFPKAILREVQSLTFCFDDCACPAADLYYKNFFAEIHRHLRAHPAVIDLVKSASSVIYEIPDKRISSDPHALKDALLAYVCHGASLPCADTYALHEMCVQNEHVTGLLSYLDWESRQYFKSDNLKRSCLLRSYGLIRNIVSHVLHLISEKRPKFVLYSGHDKTLTYLTTALGVISEETAAPYYASRLIFEIYKNLEPYAHEESGPAGSSYFFRLVFNGKDITNSVHFCKKGPFSPGYSSTVKFGKNSTQSYLCPIESIIRFLHDDYFSVFNSSNLKDACSSQFL
ncbi:hypothetical protein AAG570_006783 [Ranatra chinensis]|uniref:2-phosphoxylose phosphatase 1 n=1 Tax=Ranatra chinensis TaxID=642074 RepID=A0ABD0YVP9_9HEMI